MGRDDVKPPERKIRQHGVKLRLRVTGQKPAPQARILRVVARESLAKVPSTVSRGWASGSPLPVEASSTEARGSASRLAVWVDSRDTRISGEPSTSVATLTSEENGWPVLRSSVASAPERVAAQQILGDRDRIKILGRTRVFGQPVGHNSRQRRRAVCFGHGAFPPKTLQIPQFCRLRSHFRPARGLQGEQAELAARRFMLEGSHAHYRSRR